MQTSRSHRTCTSRNRPSGIRLRAKARSFRKGEMKAQVGNQAETLRPGDAIYYDSTHPHLVKCAGDKPTKILAVLYTGNK